MRLHYTARRSSGRVGYEYITRVRVAAEGRWFSLLQKLGVPAEILTGEIAKCPECGGTIRFTDARDRGEFLCRAAGRSDSHGDGFALVRHLADEALTFDDAVRAVGEALGQRELPDKEPEKRGSRAWRGTVDRWAV